MSKFRLHECSTQLKFSFTPRNLGSTANSISTLLKNNFGGIDSQFEVIIHKLNFTTTHGFADRQ